MKVTFSVLLALQIAAVGVFAGNNNNNNNNNNGGSSSNNAYKAYGYNFFADTQKTYYDGYQQAWRYLGWYIKCGYPSDRYDEDDSNSGNSNSGSNDNDENRWQGDNYCQRYLIWAAYVDENYEGGGIGEYYYYDPYSDSWDDSACEAHGNGRCVPMDCHLTDTTTWTLMGIFKEASYFGDDAFFEQLFKHEGYCLWNDDDLYDWMSDAREGAWTEGCVNTGVEGDSYYFDNNSGDGNYLYIDLKPTWDGNMTYGLYTDSICKTEYDGIDVEIDDVAANMGLLYDGSLEYWNEALEVYKVCQPCKAYNLQNSYSSYNNNNNDGGRRLGDDDGYNYYDDPNEGYFQCADDAGYTNCNQCMKFRTHAELEVATWEDLVTATNQGGILQVNVGGTVFGSERMSDEQYKYEEKQQKRRSELANEAKQAKQEVAAIASMTPEAEKWELYGNVAMAVGVLAFAVAILRTFRIFLNHSQQEDYSEPLLDPNPTLVKGMQ